MDDSRDEEFDPTSAERREIGREIVDESGGLGSALAHLCRGEMDRVTTWRRRLDQTTYGAARTSATPRRGSRTSAPSPIASGGSTSRCWSSS